MKRELTAQEWSLMIGNEIYYEDETTSNPVFKLIGVVAEDGMIDGAIYASIICNPILRELSQMREEEIEEFLSRFFSNRERGVLSFSNAVYSNILSNQRYFLQL